ncbi:MAG: hypothetical protein NWF07_00045, partial [Candidatus Bathyarchaeota archaeon]|nr:hypothetical protein [Candidatus Bathyarchaeota archaeon]
MTRITNSYEHNGVSVNAVAINRCNQNGKFQQEICFSAPGSALTRSAPLDVILNEMAVAPESIQDNYSSIIRRLSYLSPSLPNADELRKFLPVLHHNRDAILAKPIITSQRLPQLIIDKLRYDNQQTLVEFEKLCHEMATMPPLTSPFIPALPSPKLYADSLFHTVIEYLNIETHVYSTCDGHLFDPSEDLTAHLKAIETTRAFRLTYPTDLSFSPHLRATVNSGSITRTEPDHIVSDNVNPKTYTYVPPSKIPFTKKQSRIAKAKWDEGIGDQLKWFASNTIIRPTPFNILDNSAPLMTPLLPPLLPDMIITNPSRNPDSNLDSVLGRVIGVNPEQDVTDSDLTSLQPIVKDLVAALFYNVTLCPLSLAELPNHLSPNTMRRYKEVMDIDRDILADTMMHNEIFSQFVKAEIQLKSPTEVMNRSISNVPNILTILYSQYTIPISSALIGVCPGYAF